MDDTQLGNDAVVGILENRGRRCEWQPRNKAGLRALSCIVYQMDLVRHLESYVCDRGSKRMTTTGDIFEL